MMLTCDCWQNARESDGIVMAGGHTLAAASKPSWHHFARAQRRAVLEALEQRALDHVGGNARSGSYGSIKELGGTRHSEH